MKLTRAHIDGLTRIRDLGPYGWCAGRGRAGGAISRMFDRLAEAGLCTRPPHTITGEGRAAIAEAELKIHVAPPLRFHDYGCLKRYGAETDGPCGCERRRDAPPV